METIGSRSAHAKLAQFVRKNGSVLSGLLLFTIVAAIQTISTGHFTTGVEWVFSIGQDTEKHPALSAVQTQATLDIQTPMSAVLEELKEDSGIDDGSTDDGLPTSVQVFVYFGFLSAHLWLSTSVVNILVLSGAIPLQNLFATQFIVSQVCFFVLLMIAGAAPMKALMLTLSFMVAGVMFLLLSFALLRDQLQLLGRHVRVQEAAGQDPVMIFDTEAQQTG